MGLINAVATRSGSGGGHVRYIVKQRYFCSVYLSCCDVCSVILVPFFGVCHWLLNDLFLKRKRGVDEVSLRNSVYLVTVIGKHSQVCRAFHRAK